MNRDWEVRVLMCIVKQMLVRMRWQSGELTNKTFCMYMGHVPILYMCAMLGIWQASEPLDFVPDGQML